MKIRKIFLGFLLGCYGLYVLAAVWIHQSYFSDLPKVPNEKTGRIYQVVVHGSVRFGTGQELHVLRLLEQFRPVAFILFLFAIVLGMSWGIFKVAPGRKLNE